MAPRAARVVIAAAVAAAGCTVAGDPSRPTPPPQSRGRISVGFDGIENVRFGASIEVVVGMLRDRLGDPDDDSGWVDAFSPFGTCPGSQVRGVRWRRLRALFSDGPTDVAEGGTRHFFAYDAAQDLDPRPLDVRTDAGLALGATTADVRRLYGGDADVSDEPEFGAAASVRGPGERTLFVGLSSAQDAGRVTSFRAGAPACGE